MKTKRAILIGFLITAVMFSLIAFGLCPARSAAFFISYFSVMLGIAAYFGSMWVLILEKFEKVTWKVPLLRISSTYLITAAVLSALYAALSILFKFTGSLMGTAQVITNGVYLVLHLLLLGWAAYRVNALLAGASLITGVSEARHTQASSMRALAAQADELKLVAANLPESVRGEAGKLMGKLAESIRFSDPIVPQALVGIDQGIAQGISGLKDLLTRMAESKSSDLSPLKTQTEALATLLRDRNEQVRRAK